MKLRIMGGILVVFSLLHSGGVAAQQGPPTGGRNARSIAAGELLDRAPSGADRPEKLQSDTFLLYVRALTAGIARPESITTVAEGIKLLEGLATAGGQVYARVVSIPAGLTVTYRRTYEDPSENDPVVTTNHWERLDVATYYFFDCKDPHTGVRITQKKNCTSGCDVSFVFGNQ